MKKRGEPAPKPTMSRGEKIKATMLERYGPDYYRKITQQGGQATKESAQRDPERFKENGRKAGNRTKELYGLVHYQRARQGKRSKQDD